MNKTTGDFRTELYKKYISSFKEYIGSKDSIDIKSDYQIFSRRYIPLLKEFKRDAKIIELGCGSGYMLQFLKQHGFNNLYGIDISEEQIEKACQKGLNVEAKNVFNFFNENKEKYDIVFALDFVEHFHKNELLDLFTSINETMNNNGILIIHTPNGDGLFPRNHIYGDLTHLTIFNPNSLTQLLILTGFNEIKFYETGPEAKNFTGLIRLFLWKIVKGVVKAVRIIETGGSEKILTQDFICAARK
jgi:2-polyprenyl-3-methyl-5-hydroxy-6-metoxy-1,4-benzoquinol methylase